MRRFKGLAKDHGGLVRMCVVGVGVLILAAFAVDSASAASVGSPATKLCIPKAPGKPVKTPTRKGRCPRKYKLVELGRQGKPGPTGQEGPRGDRGEPGALGQLEALQFRVNDGRGSVTGGQVVSVPAGSYGPEKVSPENTISYGPITVPANGVVAEIHVSGRAALGEATADLHASNLDGSQAVGGVTGAVVPKGQSVSLELTHIGFQAGTDLYLKGGKLYAGKEGTYWVKVGISLPAR